MNDLTAIYYTAGVIPNSFAEFIRAQLRNALREDTKLISLSQDSSMPRSHLNIYRQALKGAKMATTKYIALCEDDVLYSPEHFKYRPSEGKFAYNVGCWSLFTWIEPAVFTYKGRKNLCNLICERELFIEAMEERFAKWPDDNKINLGIWAEPGKYERQLGVTVREPEEFYTNPPNIMFSHETALSFENLGMRKKMGNIRATAIPIWGSADIIKALYE